MQEVKDVTLPYCETLGMDQNIYALIGRVSRTLIASGEIGREKEFVYRSLSVDEYSELVALSREYVQFEIGETNVSTGG